MFTFNFFPSLSLRVTAWITLAIVGSSLPAQEDVEEPELFRLSVCTIGVDQVPSLFWKNILKEDMEPEKAYEIIRVGKAHRGSSVELPVDGDLTIYREGSLPADAAPDSPKPMIPFITIPKPDPDDQLLLILHRRASGKPSYTFQDDSADAHPANTVRFVNFTPRNAVGYVGGDAVRVAPGEGRLLGEPVYIEPNRFDFSYALETSDGSFSASQPKRLRFRSPEARLLILMTYLPETEEDEDGTVTSVEYTPIAYRLYDRVR